MPPRRRFSLGPTLVLALVIAALAPALIASWLLSVNSSKAIETLAENAMSQAAHRVDVGALAHLGESHTVVNALLPPFEPRVPKAKEPGAGSQTAHAFETMAYALTQQSVNVPYLYIGRPTALFSEWNGKNKASSCGRSAPAMLGAPTTSSAAPATAAS